MRNKKGFTLVELLAVIVVLAIITAIAIASISNVVETSRKESMKETAEQVLTGVRISLLSVGELNTSTEEGYYYFTKSLNQTGGSTSPMGGEYQYITESDVLSNTNYIKVGNQGVYRWGGSDVPECLDSEKSFVRIKKSDDGTYNYSICLTAGDGNYHVTSSIDEANNLPLSIEERLLTNGDFAMIVRESIYDSDVYKNVVNTMNTFPSTITSQKNNISKVIYKGDFQEKIDKEYNAASIKADLTYNNQGSVKAWLTSDEDRSGKYILYIKSQGPTYLTTMVSLFSDWQYVDTFDFENAKATNVTSAYGCFVKAGYYAPSFNLYNLDKLDTSNVTNMGSMFYNTAHDVSRIDMVLNLDTSSVTTMADMLVYFGYRASYYRTDISGWNTSNVTNFGGMFNGCGAMATTWTIGDLSGWDTSSATWLGGMFNSTNFSGNGKWNVGDISHWDTSNVVSMEHTFYFVHSSSGGTIDLSGWDTSNVTDMNGMFSACRGVSTIIIGDGFDMSKVTNTANMFSSCSSVVGGNGTRWNSAHIDGEYARIDGKGGPGYFTNGESGPFNLNVSSNNTSYGTVLGTGIYEKGVNVTLQATLKSGYGFIGWFIGNSMLSNQETYNINVKFDADVVGKFGKRVTLTLDSEDEDKGTVIGSGEYTSSTNATVSAVPKSGYKLEGWYKGSTLVSSHRVYTFAIENDMTLTARFEPYTGPSWDYETAAGASYGFELKSDGYYESTNKGINNSASVGVITIYNPNDTCSIDIHVINYAEASYDYGIIGILDGTLGNSNTVDSSIKWSGSNQHSTNEQIITFDNVSKGEHKIYIKYRKDGSVNSGNDSLKFRVGFDGNEPV